MSGCSVMVAVLAAAIACGAGASQAAVTVLGDGYAETCWRSARDGDATLTAEQVCTYALDVELLSRRDRAGTYVNRGVLRMRRAEYPAALADFDVAVRLDPDLGAAHVNRGAALIGLGRHADSLAPLDRGLELGVDEAAKAFYNRALAHEGLGDLKAAYLDYQRALQLDPAWSEPARELARFQLRGR